MEIEVKSNSLALSLNERKESIERSFEGLKGQELQKEPKCEVVCFHGAPDQQLSFEAKVQCYLMLAVFSSSEEAISPFYECLRLLVPHPS